FVPVCYRPPSCARYLSAERLRLQRRGFEATVHHARQADHDHADLMPLDQLGQGFEVLRLGAARQHAQGLGDGPGWITEREAEPDGARIDRQDPQGVAELLETSSILSVMWELNSCSHGRP